MIPVATRTARIPDTITVQVDTREQYPLPFPAYIKIADPISPYKTKAIRVIVENIKLDIGDYRLKEFPDDCVIERKGSPLEVIKNLFDKKDQIRTAKAFRKLSSVNYPYLFLEMAPCNLMEPPRKDGLPSYDPELVMHRLSTVVSKYGLNLVWGSRTSTTSIRRNFAICLLHLMLSYGIRNKIDVVPDGGAVLPVSG
jgi:ERCC4-type nuclease